MLKTYGDVFHGFHLRPEYKYANAEGTDRGETQRRHIAPSRIDIIGKESVRYARQDQLGVYEPAMLSSEGSVEMLRSAARLYGVRAIADYCGKSDDWRGSVHLDLVCAGVFTRLSWTNAKIWARFRLD